MKTNKRIAAMLTSGVLALTPCVAAGMTAFAGATDSYTITIDDGTNTGHSYKAYQIFAGDVSTTKSLTNITWSSDINSTAFLTAISNKYSTLFDTTMNAEQVANVLKTMGDDDEKLVEIAKIAKANMTGTGTANTNDEINVTGSGYYLVEETGSPAPNADGSNQVYSRFMMSVVGDATVYPKRVLPELHKKIVENGTETVANTASRGDVVTYRLTSSVPNMKGYDKYFFVVNDDIEPGLAFNESSVVVKINDVEKTKGADYLVQTGDEADNHSFQIVFKDFINYNTTEYIGKAITIEYTATVLNNATMGGSVDSANTNTASLTYSNNPNITQVGMSETNPDEPYKDESWDPENPPTTDNPDTPWDDRVYPGMPTGNTPEETVYTYVTDFVINKVDEKGEALADASFQLSGTSLKTVSSKGKAYTANTSGSFYKLKDGTFTETAPAEDGSTNGNYASTTIKYAETELNDTDTTPYYVEAYGVSTLNADKTVASVTFKGLGEGEYTIYEIDAPANYNKLTSPIVLTITANPSATGCTWTYSTGDDTNFPVTDNSITVKNRPGSTLPSTGGIGTKLFYFFGSLLFGGSAVLLVTRKRMSAKED